MRTCLYQEDFTYPETKVHFHLYNNEFPELHDHDYWEFFIILDGEVDHQVRSKKQNLKKGSCCLLRPWDKHRFSVPSKSYEMLNLAITDEYFHTLLDMIDTNFYHQVCAVDNPLCYELKDGVMQDFRENIHSVQTSNTVDKYASLMRLIWLDAIKIIYRSELHTNYDYPKWLNDFIQDVHRPENIIKPIAELYKLTYFSYRHLTRLFKQFTGETLNDYMLRVKLNYGALLLRSTDIGVLNISSTLGYDSLSHFIRMFKKHFKTTPRQYRKSLREKKD